MVHGTGSHGTLHTEIGTLPSAVLNRAALPPASSKSGGWLSRDKRGRLPAETKTRTRCRRLRGGAGGGLSEGKQGRLPAQKNKTPLGGGFVRPDAVNPTHKHTEHRQL